MASTGRIVASGLIAGGAYLAAQTVDLAYTGNSVDDRILLGSANPLPPGHERAIGVCIHLVTCVAASALYAKAVAPSLKGPGWLRGAIFASLENMLLYPLVLLEDFHPAIRDGRLDSYQSWTAFLQGAWRHVWFGAALGAMNRR